MVKIRVEYVVDKPIDDVFEARMASSAVTIRSSSPKSSTTMKVTIRSAMNPANFRPMGTRK